VEHVKAKYRKQLRRQTRQKGNRCKVGQEVGLIEIREKTTGKEGK